MQITWSAVKFYFLIRSSFAKGRFFNRGFNICMYKCNESIRNVINTTVHYFKGILNYCSMLQMTKDARNLQIWTHLIASLSIILPIAKAHNYHTGVKHTSLPTREKFNFY